MLKKAKVFVGLSGGVDSSVSAALLKKGGYDVVGVFLKVWQPPFLECTWKEERLDAMRVAAHLDIPFMTLDLEKEYKESVADYMIAEYKVGRTPNPDVMCNKTIKFGAFLKKAKEMGADFVATGHYAQNIEKKGVFELHAGVDDNKDQSYFLWTLSQEQLKYILFPVGGMVKPDVRKVAAKFKLPTAQKKDSQGLCFIGKLDMKDFLKEFIPEKKGDVLNEEGNVVGVHDGAAFFTLGQRHGFIITEKTPDDAPYYVVAKNVLENTITVSNKKDKHLIRERTEAELTNVNFIGGELKNGAKVSARVRYRQKLHSVTVVFEDNKTKIVFKESQTVDAGQSVVLYKGSRCLGGGVIV
jgi:tRNA-specific 2-thiouridylase